MEFIVLVMLTFVLPVMAGVVMNWVDEGAESRKGTVGVCPPHKWIFQIDDINTMSDNLVCEHCNYRNSINNY